VLHRCSIAVVAISLAAGCASPAASGDDAPPMKDKEPTGGDDDESSSGGPPIVLGDLCEAAPVVGTGRFVATIYNAASDVDGACGEGGPEVFVRVATEVRADLELAVAGSGFVPRLGVLGSSCTDDWAAEGIACTRGLPATVLDVPAGSSVLVAIGIAGDDPLLASADSDRDMLFALDVALRRVLAPGERCGLPGLGRCEGGSACELGQDSTMRCAALEGDTCSTAQPVDLSAVGSISVTIDPAVPQTDAHAHSCTGARRPERVLQLRLPDALPPAAQLSIATAAADVGLALRGPGCLPSDELACAAPSPDGTATTVDALVQRQGGFGSVFAFVELPVSQDDLDGAAGELAPFEVSFTLVTSP
jgi:hypothetical protein